jgi:glycosyltransferase involved in cell wall biosynthesis
MKFSIIIPTQDRPALLAVTVKYAMQLQHANFEVIVSDNSTSDAWKKLNFDAVCGYDSEPNFKLVHPPKVLSPPENFEFALDYATGDYVMYLTDKMVILPNVLSEAEAAIKTSKADIVNWANAPYYIDNIEFPAGSGRLVEESEFLSGQPKKYSPRVALKFKASGIVPRNKQQTRDYVIGKLIFGCYSRELIERIKSRSGTVFGGATHDYSAMIQALSLANTCVMLNTYGVIFISLPPDQSLGSLTAADSQRALMYYRSFTEPDAILASLLVPGIYASQHNMVAHDYKKFLPIYGNLDLFNETNWLTAIYSDLISESKVWADSEEMNSQLTLFKRHVDIEGKRLHMSVKRMFDRLAAAMLWIEKSIVFRVIFKILRRSPQSSSASFGVSSLEEAIHHIQINSIQSKSAG